MTTDDIRPSSATVRWLLITSLILTLSKALTLPVIAVYLSNTLELGTTKVGFILSTSLAFGTLSSLVSGYIIDHADRRALLLAGTALYGATWFAFSYIHDGWTVFALLSLSYSASSLLDIALKAYIAQIVAPADRGKVFSVRYTLNNVGFAIGPMLGAFLALYGEATIFRLAGFGTLICTIPVVVLWRSLKQQRIQSGPPDSSRSFYSTLCTLTGDVRLMMFTLAGIFSAVVYARFSSYLSQYLSLTTNVHVAYQTVAYSITVNAVIVTLVQYLIGSRITVSRLRSGMTIGMALFGVGLLGFSRSTDTTGWMISMAIFSLGEVVVIPASYLFVDSIAPEDMKGSYYGMQSLTNLGGAASPALCGLLLSTGQPVVMFWALIAVCFFALMLYLIGDCLSSMRSSISMPPPNR
ncbi:MFS transporter [Paraburkholderia bannensis]|uniref:MFS transporter n=1 Tax=Paraburkholderia bannensis TaxID=765414 RepID=UPI002AB7EAFA|nr:MFS transporter [Paraburkholderia bannensis]